MKDSKETIKSAYAAFNERNIDAALALMTEDVQWPKASEGGHVVGKSEIRAYWARQWGEFDPHVEPFAMSVQACGDVSVTVRQRVKSLNGQMLSDSEVLHVFSMKNGLIASMSLGNSPDSSQAPSAAFAHRS